MKRAAVALLFGMAASADGIGVAGAACNAIPDKEMLSVAGKTSFGFKGALGRIDRVHLLPADVAPTDRNAPAMIVVPDGICVGADGRGVRTPPSPLGAVNDLTVLVYFRSADGGRISVRPYASATACEALARATPDASVEVLPGCSLDGVKIVSTPAGDGLRVPLPRASERSATHATADVRIVVARNERAGAFLQRDAAARSCSQMCGEPAGMLACIDDIYASIGPAGQPKYAPDPVPCTVQIPPGVGLNDFSKGCEHDTGTPPCPGGGLPQLKFWQDKCGGVHVPFDWKGIRPDPDPDGTIKPRWARGRTGVGREASDKDPSVWIPGREFAGSTPWADPQGTAPGVNWRKPWIKVWRGSDSDESGLEGTVDQDDSIVHVFPRLRTQLVCAGTSGANACMAVEHDPTEGGYVTCACEDRGDPGCSCEELATPRYFVCDVGSKAGMPCTRDRHCNPDGFCRAKPHCQEEGLVWTGLPDSTGKECTVDDDCLTEGTKTQCGHRLFNFEKSWDVDPMGPNKPFVVTLDKKIVSGGMRQRRGACTNGMACGNGMGPSPCAAGDCRGYELRAGALLP
jgi:hypothetical protein